MDKFKVGDKVSFKFKLKRSTVEGTGIVYDTLYFDTLALVRVVGYDDKVYSLGHEKVVLLKAYEKPASEMIPSGSDC